MTKITNDALGYAFRVWAEEHKGSGPVEDDIIYLIEQEARLAPPAGFVVVPVEPTPEMLEAAGTMDNYDVDAGGRHDDDHIAWWKAMIAAAPGAADGVRGGYEP